ncbi:MAG TPA: sulfatase [Thermoanaerobaculia bacterium]
MNLVHARQSSKALALLLLLAFLAAGSLPARQAEPQAQRFPNVVILTIDTLRADRLSSYGYRRPTSPNIDRLLNSGARFTQARTVEPLTNPAMCSLFTSLYPHEHGGTRNGLRMHPNLPSMARVLDRRGYRSAAFVGNWTLKNRISGLGDHFERYDEVFTRKRWLGMFKGEATAEDLSDSALAWLEETRKNPRHPFLLWVHYVEPHAPYRLQEDFAGRLGVKTKGEVSRQDRYDTEIAFTDHHLGRLLQAFERDPALKANTIIVFAADHGESLGEHGYWGHGRNLYEPNLHIPMGIVWPGKIRPGTIVGAPALNIDVAPTILGLTGLPAPDGFKGLDWTSVLLRGAPQPHDRVTWFQAHKGAVLTAQEANGARRNGLLEVGILADGRKEIFRVSERQLNLFDLTRDPREIKSLARKGGRVSERLHEWMASVQKGLIAADRLGPAEVDPENAEQLRALGYIH